MTYDELFAQYKNGVGYNTIIEKLSNFLAAPLIIIENKDAYEEWLAFLDILRYIEKTIPTYDEQLGKIDDHTNWFKRVLIFVRAYLEETEVLMSKFSLDNHLVFYKPTITKHEIFHPGAGTSDPDLEDNVTHSLYDVKHNSSDFSKAHKANYIIKYQPDGICTVHSKLKFEKGEPSYIGYFECSSVADLATAVGLPADIFSLSEKALEQLFEYKQD